MPGNTDRTQKVLPSWSWWPTSGNQASEREAHLLCFSFPPWLPVSFTPDLNDYRVLGQSTWLWPEFPLVHSSDGCLRIHTWPGGKVGPPLGHMGCPSSSLFSRLRERIWFSDEMDQTSVFRGGHLCGHDWCVHLPSTLWTPVIPSCRQAAEEMFALEKIYRISGGNY